MRTRHLPPPQYGRELGGARAVPPEGTGGATPLVRAEEKPAGQRTPPSQLPSCPSFPSRHLSSETSGLSETPPPSPLLPPPRPRGGWVCPAVRGRQERAVPWG